MGPFLYRIIFFFGILSINPAAIYAQCIAPIGIDTAQMILWLCPDSAVYNSSGNPASAGEEVYEWHDISGNGWVFENTINANRPTLETVSGNTYLDFIPGDFLDNIGIRDSINGLNEFSIFMVVESRVTNTDNGFLYHTYPPDGADDLLCLRYDLNGANTGRSNVIKTGLLGNTAGNQVETTANTQTTNRQVINITWQSGGRLYSYLDGVANDSSSNNVTGPMSGINELLIGKGAKDNNTNEGWDGYIGTVIFYKTALPPDDIADASSSLPIELVYFNAKLSGGKVELNWKTASETNNEYFTIEKSRDGKAFEVVGIIAGAGTSSSALNYTTFDDNPYPGISYYRLKQTDFDGKFEYSELVSVYNSRKDASEIKLFNNPSDGGTFQLYISGEKDEHILLNVFSTSSKIVYSETFLIENNSTIKDIQLADPLEPGLYFVSGTNSNGNLLFRKKLIVK